MTRCQPENDPDPHPDRSRRYDTHFHCDNKSYCVVGSIRGIIYTCSCRRPSLPVLPVCLPYCLAACGRKTARHMVVAVKYTVVSSLACVGCVLWRSETALGGSLAEPLSRDTTICGRFLTSANCKNASVIAAAYSQTLGRWCQGTGDF